MRRRGGGDAAAAAARGQFFDIDAVDGGFLRVAEEYCEIHWLLHSVVVMLSVRVCLCVRQGVCACN